MGYYGFCVCNFTVVSTCLSGWMASINCISVFGTMCSRNIFYCKGFRTPGEEVVAGTQRVRYNVCMTDLEDKYSRFLRNTDIDLQAEIAAGGGEGGLDNYYTKSQSNVITDALDERIVDLEDNPSGGVSDHGALTGLSDDDHIQYHTDARGDIRYYTKSQSDTNYQPKDSDLTSFAGLSPSNDDIVQRKAGAWTNRTPSQIKTDLSLGKTDVGLSNVDNTSDVNKPVSTATQSALDSKASSTHNHDDRYFTETETTNLLNAKAALSDTPRYLMFNVTWPARPADSRMTFYIGGDSVDNPPLDSALGDVWIPLAA